MSDPNFGPFLDTNDIPSTQSLFENISCLTPISDSHNPAKEAFDSAKAMCTGSLPPRMHSVVVSAVRECVRPDYRQYMVEQVPRWAERGLWHQEQRLVPAGSTASYDGLIRLYYYVCQLDQQMADDDIRKRASLVLLHHQYEELSSHKASIEDFDGQSGLTGPGRGHASVAVDRLLSNIYPEWNTCHAKHKTALRTTFHNRKRYGKRWSILVNCLGPGILFICSSRLIGIVYVFSSFSTTVPTIVLTIVCRTNTKITMETLKIIGNAVSNVRSDVQSALHVINPISRDLIFDSGFDCHAVEGIIRDLQ